MTPRARPAFLDALTRALPADLLSLDDEDRREYGQDWTSEYAGNAGAIAFPRTTDEVAQILTLCAKHQIPVVPSGGRTGLAGGAAALHGELVLSLQRMNRIEPVDTVGQTVRVQAGAITEAVHQAVLEHGLTWPVDFASKGSSQIGGNVATNAGGVRVIRYGHTRHWVLGLEVVTAHGEVLELNGALEKNNTGLDLRQLFIGSEGTLGVITAATLKLCPKPGETSVLLFALTDFESVMRLFAHARSAPFTLAAYEFFSDRCMHRLARHRKIEPPFAQKAASYALLEVEQATEDALLAWTQSALEIDGVLDGTMAQSQSQAATLWALREGISESLSATGVPHKNDVALPVRELASFVREVEIVFSSSYPNWDICLFGHVGDGNIHINVMKPDDMPREQFFEKTHEADRDVFTLVQKYQGSISAEHGIGLLKKDFLPYSRSAEEIAMLKAVKHALDPQGILNPGKIFDSSAPAR